MLVTPGEEAAWPYYPKERALLINGEMMTLGISVWEQFSHRLILLVVEISSWRMRSSIVVVILRTYVRTRSRGRYGEPSLVPKTSGGWEVV